MEGKVEIALLKSRIIDFYSKRIDYYVLLHIKSSRYRKYTKEMLKKLSNRDLLFKLPGKCFTVTSSSLKYVLPAEPQGKPKNTGVGNLSLLQQIFLTQELNQGLLHCRWILYQLNYQGSLICPA